MNRINQLFTSSRGPILSVYFCAGHPQPDATLSTLRALQEGGVGMVEVGIPFSDPLADGPVIQRASTQALRGGMSLRKLFGQLEGMRPEISLPVVLMGYLNPVLQYGYEAFCRSCARVGVDGVILPDLPFADYLRDFKPLADRYGLKVIMLITPETSEARIREIDAHTDGFIYMVSSAAVTGERQSFDEASLAYFGKVESMHLRNPRMIGFGISNPETCSAAAAHAAGVIVGSKFVSLLEETGGDAPEAVRRLRSALGV